MIKKIVSNYDSDTREVYITAFKAMLVKVLGVLAGLLISIFLARSLGSDGLGVVNFANRVLMILLLLTTFGFDHVIVKFIAIAKKKLDSTSIKSTLKTSLLFNGVLSFFIASIGVILLQIFINFGYVNRSLFKPIIIVLVMLIPQTITMIYRSALNGYGKIWQANLIKQTLSLTLVGLGLFFYWFYDVSITPISVLLLYAIARVILAVVVYLMWRYTFKSKSQGQYDIKPMIKMGRPMLLVAGAGVISSNVDVFMLSAFGTFDDIGIYTVAAQIAMLTAFFLQVTNSAIAPKLASLFSSGRIEQMERMVQSVTRGLIVLGLISTIVYIIFGKSLLALWGNEFHNAYPIMIVIVIGQFSNLATGCSGMLLVMCGLEKTHGYLSLFSFLLNIILNLLFIFSYGVLGVAIATASTAVIVNISQFILVKRKLGISIVNISFI